MLRLLTWIAHTRCHLTDSDKHTHTIRSPQTHLYYTTDQTFCARMCFGLTHSHTQHIYTLVRTCHTGNIISCLHDTPNVQKSIWGDPKCERTTTVRWNAPRINSPRSSYLDKSRINMQLRGEHTQTTCTQTFNYFKCNHSRPPTQHNMYAIHTPHKKNVRNAERLNNE